jgi:hypothetical protein
MENKYVIHHMKRMAHKVWISITLNHQGGSDCLRNLKALNSSINRSKASRHSKSNKNDFFY